MTTSLVPLPEAATGEKSLFDSLSRLVPSELQREYYRVLAHTRSLNPDDEMLKILEAMGILALVTRHTPADIAVERERIKEMLDLHLQFSDESQQKMLEYVHFIEGRLAGLPSEIEVGLDPQQIAKILGESLRQHFVQCGVTETVARLQTTATAIGSAQAKLTRALMELSDSRGGIVAQVEGANRRIISTLEQRVTGLDSLLHEFKSDLLRVWIPFATSATLLIGVIVGMEIQGCRDTAPIASAPSVSATELAPAGSDSQSNGLAAHPRRDEGKQAKSRSAP